MPVADHSKRLFFKRATGQHATVFHPPWAVANFTDRCTRCDACIERCEERILVRGDGGFPEVDFSRGGCTWCGACAEACAAHAIDASSNSAWQLKASIDDRCLSMHGIICRSCGDVCETRAIIFHIQTGGRAIAEIATALCDGCGFCFSVCPHQAIQIAEVK